jgi:hypothetical protein
MVREGVRALLGEPSSRLFLIHGDSHIESFGGVIEKGTIPVRPAAGGGRRSRPRRSGR